MGSWFQAPAVQHWPRPFELFRQLFCSGIALAMSYAPCCLASYWSFHGLNTRFLDSKVSVLPLEPQGPRGHEVTQLCSEINSFSCALIVDTQNSASQTDSSRACFFFFLPLSLDWPWIIKRNGFVRSCQNVCWKKTGTPRWLLTHTHRLHAAAVMSCLKSYLLALSWRLFCSLSVLKFRSESEKKKKKPGE